MEKELLSPSERALQAIKRRIAQIRCQQGEQRATEVATGALMMLVFWARRPRPRRKPQGTPALTLPCPHCRRPSDVSRRRHGENIWCTQCGKWALMIMRPDGVSYLAKCDPPAGVEQPELPIGNHINGH
jgi:hypothetical protein